MNMDSKWFRPVAYALILLICVLFWWSFLTVTGVL